MLPRIKLNDAIGTVASLARHKCDDLHRAERTLRTVSNIQGVNLVMKTEAGLIRRAGKCIHIQRAGSRINDGRAGDADLRQHILINIIVIAPAEFMTMDKVNSPAQIVVPQQPAIRFGVAVRVKGIDTIVGRRHKDDVPHALSRNRQPGNIQRLGIDISIHRILSQQAERLGVYVGRSQ